MKYDGPFGSLRVADFDSRVIGFSAPQCRFLRLWISLHISSLGFGWCGVQGCWVCVLHDSVRDPGVG